MFNLIAFTLLKVDFKASFINLGGIRKIPGEFYPLGNNSCHNEEFIYIDFILEQF